MQVNHPSESAIELVLQLDEPLAFLPTIHQHSGPGHAAGARLLFQLASGRAREGRFLIRNVPGG